MHQYLYTKYDKYVIMYRDNICYRIYDTEFDKYINTIPIIARYVGQLITANQLKWQCKILFHFYQSTIKYNVCGNFCNLVAFLL